MNSGCSISKSARSRWYTSIGISPDAFFNKFYYGYVKKIYEKPYTTVQRKKIINDAISWAKTQLNKKYQFFQYENSTANWNPKDILDPFADRWYCSELVWAAYMNATNGKLNIGDRSKKRGTKYEEIWVRHLQEDIKNIQLFTPKNPPIP